jgi:hypothetical protein
VHRATGIFRLSAHHPPHSPGILLHSLDIQCVRLLSPLLSIQPILPPDALAHGLQDCRRRGCESSNLRSYLGSWSQRVPSPRISHVSTPLSALARVRKHNFLFAVGLLIIGRLTRETSILPRDFTTSLEQHRTPGLCLEHLLDSKQRLSRLFRPSASGTPTHNALRPRSPHSRRLLTSRTTARC